MPRARAHAAVGSMALSARVLCRCGGNGADASRRATQPAPNVVRSACGLTPMRRPRRRRRRRRTLLVLDDHRRHATESSAFLRSPPVGARLRARRSQVRCPRRLARLRFKRPPSHARSVVRGAWSAERGAWCAEEAPERRAERGARCARAERGARCAAGFRVHPLLQLLLRGGGARATRGARSAERGMARMQSTVRVSACVVVRSPCY